MFCNILLICFLLMNDSNIKIFGIYIIIYADSFVFVILFWVLVSSLLFALLEASFNSYLLFYGCNDFFLLFSLPKLHVIFSFHVLELHVLLHLFKLFNYFCSFWVSMKQFYLLFETKQSHPTSLEECGLTGMNKQLSPLLSN